MSRLETCYEDREIDAAPCIMHSRPPQLPSSLGRHFPQPACDVPQNKPVTNMTTNSQNEQRESVREGGSESEEACATPGAARGPGGSVERTAVFPSTVFPSSTLPAVEPTVLLGPYQLYHLHCVDRVGDEPPRLFARASLGTHLGFGRIVVSEKEAPSMFVNMV